MTPSAGTVTVDGHDVQSEFRAARARIGLVPQELATSSFESVMTSMRFSRGLFGKLPDPKHLEQVLKSLSLWDKRDSKIMTLSGGMKRRVMIAKALSHEPQILFLDEPTAGVDVELRRAMWDVVRSLRDTGVTIILTTHYIEEAEEMADRIGVIDRGRLILVENKSELMRQARPQTSNAAAAGDARVACRRSWLHCRSCSRRTDASSVTPTTKHGNASGIAALLDQLHRAGIRYKDLHTSQSSLEEIFVALVGRMQ